MKNIVIFPRKKSRDKFEELVGPHLEHLYRVAYRFCGTRDDAEDLVQDLIIKLYATRKELETVEQLRPWLARALYNLYVDNIRRYQRSPIMQVPPNEEHLLAEITDTANTPDQDHERRQKLQQLQRMFDQLSDEHRTILTLHDMEGYNLPELEKIMGIPVGTLKSRLHRARERLRDLVQKDGTF